LKKVALSLAVLIAAGCGFVAGWKLHERAAVRRDKMRATTEAVAPSCVTAKYLEVYFKGPSEPTEVEWQLCSQPNGEPPLHYVRAHDFRHDLYTFGPADQITQLAPVDLHGDEKQQLLIVEQSSGTGAYIKWCVLGWTVAGLRCWKAPDVDDAAHNLIREDEDLCCKGWTLKLAAGRIVIGEGVYHKGVDANCCPSRGGVFLELSPEGDSFGISKAWRTDAPTYDRWARFP
jgi:hypothetical protein